MADWRQIQARIRKAKASGDAPAKLAELYEQTRDAMVAFELARWQEKAGEHAEAARWYTAAAERFRRSQWKSKAEAALARLKAPRPSATEMLEHSDSPQAAAEEAPAEPESQPSSEIRSADSSPVTSGLSASETEAETNNIGNVEAAPEVGNQSHRTTAVRANAAVPGGAAQDEQGRRRPRRRG